MTKRWGYVRVKAPPEYPGKVYASGWCLEHHLVWWQHTGELVAPGMHIHHRDRDPTNNAFANLVVLSSAAHAAEHGKYKSRTIVELTCPICEIKFVRERRQTHLAKPRQQSTCCSRACSAVKSNM